MPTDLLPALDHELFDTDVRPFELLRLLEELTRAPDGNPAHAPTA